MTPETCTGTSWPEVVLYSTMIIGFFAAVAFMVWLSVRGDR